MADTPKRRRLEKTPGITPISNQKWYCPRCGTAYSRQKGYFPVSHSPMYRKAGYLPWCNDCIEEMYDEYREILSSDKAAMRRMCMKLDLYWDEAIYDMVDKSVGVQSRVRNYIGKTNINRYIDKTFDDTIAREDAEAAKEAANKPQDCSINDAGALEVEDENEYEVSDEVRRFWGSGYTPQMYEELEERRHYLLGQYPNGFVPDIGTETLIRQICGLEVDIAHDRAAGRSVEKNVKTLNDLLGSANLKPVQQKDMMADADLENMPLGVGIEKWEYRRPLPVTDEGLRDVNHRIRDITTWYLGHGAKMVNLRGAHVQMYEDAMNRLRVKHPEYEDDDDDTMLTDIFGDSKAGDPDE